MSTALATSRKDTVAPFSTLIGLSLNASIWSGETLMRARVEVDAADRRSSLPSHDSCTPWKQSARNHPLSDPSGVLPAVERAGGAVMKLQHGYLKVGYYRHTLPIRRPFG